MAMKSARDLPKIGYVYHYPQLDQPNDTFRLDIFISSIPTEQHFDVLRVNFDGRYAKGGIESFTVTHPWHYEKTVRVCAGVIRMEDRIGKKEEAFTFGGQLSIDNQKMQTICVLVSSAPILEISEATPLQQLYIEELKIILAQHRAANLKNHDYERRLSEIDPLELYLACLEELIQKFEQFPRKDEKYLKFLMFLHSQKHRLQAAGLYRTPVYKIDDLIDR